MTIKIIPPLEELLLHFESSTGFKVTIIDHRGFFVGDQGQRLFPAPRYSHQGNISCTPGFKKGPCVAHCRHAMVAKSKSPEIAPFIHQCWRDVVEMVFPLHHQQQLCGLLYIGHGTNPLSFYGSPHEDLMNRMKWLKVFVDGFMHEILKYKYQHRNTLSDSIYQWLEAHVSQRPRVTQLAQHLNLSTSRCSHVVKEQLGQSFQQVVTKMKVNSAKGLLCNTQMRINEISTELGFTDAYHFSHFFKKEVGLSPRTYRTNLEQEN